MSGRDPRDYQVAVLGLLLAYGLGWLDFDLGGGTVFAILSRSRGMRGPTGSWNACKGRFFMNIGGSNFGATTSPACGSCRGRSITFSASTITSAPHRGYRLGGRTPATLFWGAIAA